VRGFLRSARFRQDAGCVLGQRLARLGQGEAARGAVEQRLAEMRFQSGDRLGDGGLGQADRVGGGAEGAVLHYGGEDRPGFEIG